MGAGLGAPWPDLVAGCNVVLLSVPQLCHHSAATTNAATPSAHPLPQLEAELASAGLLGPRARPLEFGDLNALAYLNAVLKEAMRLHPVASVGSVRWVCSGSWGSRVAPGCCMRACHATFNPCTVACRGCAQGQGSARFRQFRGVYCRT